GVGRGRLTTLQLDRTNRDRLAVRLERTRAEIIRELNDDIACPGRQRRGQRELQPLAVDLSDGRIELVAATQFGDRDGSQRQQVLGDRAIEPVHDLKEYTR